MIRLVEQEERPGIAQDPAETLEYECLQASAVALHIQAERLPTDSLWRPWLARFATGLEKSGVDDPTADLLMGTTKASGRLLVLVADLSKQEPSSAIAREIQGIARDLQEVQVVHPAARLLLEAGAGALGGARDSPSVGEIERERSRIQRVLEKYRLNPPASEEEKIEYEDAVTAEGELRDQAIVYIAKGEGDDAVLVARAVLGDKAVA